MQPETPPADQGQRRRALFAETSILVLALVAVAVAFLLRVEGARHVFAPLGTGPLPDLCVWKRSLGGPCPGCGLTRSVVALAHGEVARAWQFHPAGLAAAAWILLQIPCRSLSLWRLARGGGTFARPWMNLASWCLAIGVLTGWAARLAGLVA